MRICDRCDDIVRTSKTGIVSWSVSRSDLLQGRSGRCQFCILFLKTLDEFFSGLEPSKKVSICRTDGDRSFRIICQNLKIHEDARTLDVYAPIGKEISCWPTLPCAPELPTPFVSEGAFSIMKGYLTTCLVDHIQTCGVARARRLPTRLLNVKSGRVTIVETPIGTQYAALSYCWGGRQSLTLIESSKDQLYAGVTVEDLPAVIQDAARVTRELGLEWLWVDALCIFQDSADDWEYESSNMADYYSGALVTIAASYSSNVNEPLLKMEGNNALCRPVDFPFRCPEEGVKTVRVRRRVFGSINSGALRTRAWTLQETALSTRILHFTPTEVVWECRTKHDPEHDPRDYFGVMQEYNDKTLRPPAYDIWCYMVREYSTRALTNPSDKLPAISALASGLAEIYTSTSTNKQSYLSGLWREHLPLHLMWRTCNDPSRARSEFTKTRSWLPISLSRTPATEENQIPGYDPRIPSWSWASLPFAVLYPHIANRNHYKELYEKRKILVDIEAAECELHTTHNPYGAIKNGWIILSGPCLTVQLYAERTNNTLRYYAAHDRMPDDVNEVSGDTILVSSSQVPESQRRSSCPIQRSLSMHATRGLGLNETAQVLLVYRYDDETPVLYGLVLSAWQDKEQVYSRIGYIRFRKGKSSDWLRMAERKRLMLV
ncbi:HET-domain-containing protein [Lophiostoma macrostomum CBS 122681]|uniref:HET-domain-containing protein n=1 Tax=Lophiostoma macrostomum CBS 122681 TaxID=1314788 RepID=A0A6A6SQD7_9PLEO|nr:HET-domain-containing protein [Lophiostoma macrostomum CBS 122681]